MRNFVLSLVALTLIVGCEEWDNTTSTNVNLSDVTIECIGETTIINNTSGNKPFTKHTYLCRGYIGGFKGDCAIRVLHENFIVHENHNLTIAGEKLPFEFTFAPEWEYLDQPNLNFIIEVLNSEDMSLCSTTIVVTKHPEKTSMEIVDIPFVEYSLWGTACEWQLPQLNNNVIIVNSDEELARYIQSTSGESYPSVDFDKYTMIIAHGYNLNGIAEKRINSLQRVSNNELALNIEIYSTLADVIEPWNFVILVDKLDKLYNINLNVDTRDVIN